jgi:hypothetical protein
VRQRRERLVTSLAFSGTPAGLALDDRVE